MSADIYNHDFVLRKAHDLFIERNAIRGAHWRQCSVDDHIRQIETKTGRLRMIEKLGRDPLPVDLEEALDIINYGTFVYQLLVEQMEIVHATKI